MVFQTTPPQPASKARWAWYAVLAGGPLATQNGFGDLIPARLMDRSAMDLMAKRGKKAQKECACALWRHS